MSKKDFQNPWGDEPDDLEQTIKKSQEKIINFFNKHSKSTFNKESGSGGGFEFPQDNKKMLQIVAGVLLAGYLSTGFYTVQPDEQGVVMRLGEYNRTSSSGLNYKLPAPIERVRKVSVTNIIKEEVGFRAKGQQLSRQQLLQSSIPTESQMLTTDENIVDINFEVQWRKADAKKYLFNVRDVRGENTIKNVAESAMREVIGVSSITKILAEERSEIEHKVKDTMQSILDNYDMGVNIERVQLLRADPPQNVIDAYRDVQNAKQDKERLINQAYSYRNDIVPKARGEAEQVLQAAEGYKQTVIAEARGESKRFSSIYDQYRYAKDITRKRMYIETMEEVMSNLDKVIVDKGASGVVPYLALPELKNKSSN